MGDQPSKGDSNDQVEILCNAMKQMHKAQGGTDAFNDGDLRNKLMSAKDAVSRNGGQEPAFHKIIEELEAKSTSSIRVERAEKEHAGQQRADRPVEKKTFEAKSPHKQAVDGRQRLELVFSTAVDGNNWETKIAELAQASGLSGGDLDDGTLFLQDASGVAIPTDTEEPPDWDSLRYPVSGHVYTQPQQTKDISWGSDGSLTKTQLRGGYGEDVPRNTAKVKMKVEAATDGIADVPDFKPCTLEFVVGDGAVCDALEIAAMSMKRCERAQITCSDIALCSDESHGSPAVSTGKIVFTLELAEFDKVADLTDMSEADAIRTATSNKESGSDLFRRGRTRLALARYKTVLDLFSNMEQFSDENQAKASELMKLCELNRAACHLALENYIEAKQSTNFVLRHDHRHVKALYRRAQCDIGCSNFVDAIIDLKKVIVVDPQNRAARSLLKDTLRRQQQVGDQSRSIFERMLHGPNSQLKPEQSHELELVEKQADQKEEDLELVEKQADHTISLQDAEAAAKEAADSLLKEVEAETPKASRKKHSKKAKGKGHPQHASLVDAPVSQIPAKTSRSKVCDVATITKTEKAHSGIPEASQRKWVDEDLLGEELEIEAPKASRKKNSKKARGKGLVEAPITQLPIIASPSKICDVTAKATPTSPDASVSCRPLRWADEDLSDEELSPTTCGLQERWDNNKIELRVSLDFGSLLALSERKKVRLIKIEKACNATCVLDEPASAVLVCGPALAVAVAQNMLLELRSQWMDVSEPVWKTIKEDRSELQLWQTETGCSIKLDNSAPRIRLTGFSHEVTAICDKLCELQKCSGRMDVGVRRKTSDASTTTITTLEPEPTEDHDESSSSSSH